MSTKPPANQIIMDLDLGDAKKNMEALRKENVRTTPHKTGQIETKQTDITKLMDLVPFKDEEQKARAHRTAYMLTKVYGNRGWVISAKPRLILIKLWELYKLGGTNIAMVINQDDWDTEQEYEALAIKKAGELLERANMLRRWSGHDFEIITEIPHGFEEFLPKTKYKVIDKVDQVVDMVKNFEKEQEALKSSNGESGDK